MATASSVSAVPTPAPAPAPEKAPEKPLILERAPESITVEDLLAAGLHFGHQTKRWNPKMKRYIFSKRNGIHIIDLTKSLAKLREALAFMQNAVANGRKILFVGTKKQAQAAVKETAVACGQPYVVSRWLGGTMTNNVTIRRSIKRMQYIEDLEKNNILPTMHKKEASRLRHEMEKLRRNLAGLVSMTEPPGAIFVVDVNRERNAVAEANRLKVPVIAIVDTNCNPDPIDYVIPGNDDAIRAINLMAGAIAYVIKKGSADYARLASEQVKRSDEARKAERKPAEAGEGAEGDAKSARKKTPRKKAPEAEKPAEKAVEKPAAKPEEAAAAPAPAAEAPAAEVPAVEGAPAPAEPDVPEEGEEGEFTEYEKIAKASRKSHKVALMRPGKEVPKEE